ncbi:protein PHYTOCHROME KINASE SUBSTRATE 4 [Cornus florida]|uniref:protein PHYTOCHROME KINASE SUBSTRATE 4 n=1 Tax=Cornus florida TaxID=4283 RepID=UPI00289BFEEF|nr:protein PHYTOCHROME KINASE SUBSTRATE 4 [Cornus florida]
METSLHFISFAQKNNNNNNLRNASFGSYVTPEEPKADDSELSIFDAQKYFNESNDQKENNNNRVVSLADFKNAEQQQCHPSALPRLSSASSVDGYRRNYRARSFHATPTASSEASWNSQTGLLSNPPGSVPVSLRNLPGHDHDQRRTLSSTASKWLNFGRKCPCAGKKSVQVEENLSSRTSNGVDSSCTKRHSPKSVDHQILAEKKESIKSQNSSIPYDQCLVKGSYEREIPNPDRFHFASEIAQERVLRPGRSFTEGTGGFSFPILNPTSPVKLVLKGSSAPPISPNLEDPPRESLEVFHPLDETIPNKSHPGGARDRHSFGFPVSPTSRVSAIDDDVASNASSDLFEIESFSTQTTAYPMYRRRDSLDEASNFNARRLGGSSSSGGLYCRRSLDEPMTPSIEPTECYEPSEASIDWSVTTAEGFDRASVTNFSVSASEFEDIPATRGVVGGTITMYGSRGGGECGSGDDSKRRGNGGLLSCRHEKAVSVGPQPVKCGSEGHRNASNMALSSKTRHVSSRPHTFNKPPLAHAGTHAHSARLSLAFAT